MYGHERSLVRKFEGRPFAMVGVNTDPKPRFASAAAREQMTWRSFSDVNTGGPISTAWNVKGWPSVFILDHKGVLRHKHVGDPGEDFENEVEALVKEAEAAAKK